MALSYEELATLASDLNIKLNAKFTPEVLEFIALRFYSDAELQLPSIEEFTDQLICDLCLADVLVAAQEGCSEEDLDKVCEEIEELLELGEQE